MKNHKGFTTLWNIVLAAILTIDFDFFSADHVPYWAYAIKFFVLLGLVAFMFSLTTNNSPKKPD